VPHKPDEQRINPECINKRNPGAQRRFIALINVVARKHDSFSEKRCKPPYRQCNLVGRVGCITKNGAIRIARRLAKITEINPGDIR